ncbi:MAG: hemolysin family protein [Candidatus Krumholzibacteriia bacterium]
MTPLAGSRISRPHARAPHLLLRVVVACTAVGFAAVAVAAGAPDESSLDIGGGDLRTLMLWVLLALVFSFLCSISEAVLLSITPVYIERLGADRPRLAQRLYRLKVENVDRSLAAILTLNTIAHTVGAIGAGAEAVALFGSAFFGAFTAAMTLAILFLSEIVPKTVGAVYWRSLAAPTAWFVQALIWIMYPLIRLSELLTRWIGHGRPVHAFSRAEFAAMASLGQRAGKLRKEEFQIVQNLLLLDTLTVGDIMTPRPVVEALSEDLTISQAADLIGRLPFSRLPVYHGSIDHITGFVLKDDILLQQASGNGDAPLRDHRREIPTVLESMRLPRLLEVLLERRRSHIAVVIDEYGGTEGIVTMEDAVETLLGMEIVDELDQNVDMQALARERWRLRATQMGLDVDEAMTRRDPRPPGNSRS